MVDASPRRLPIEVVVRRSFLYAWESRAVFAVPYAIYAAVTMLADVILLQTLGSEDHVAVFLLNAAEQIFAMAFAVGIHRFVLVGEAPAGFQFFRWDRHFVQYVLVALLLLIMGISAAIMVMGVIGDPTAPPSGAGGASALFGLVALMVIALVLSRLALTLPWAALGDQIRPRQIWQATERNGFRILAATLITLLPFIVVEGMLVSLVPASGGGAAALIVIALLSLITPIQLIVLTIMMSLTYDVLVRGGGPRAG